MKLFIRDSLVFLMTAFLISSCNLPISQNHNDSPSARLMVSVTTATEYRTGPGEMYDVVGSLSPGQSAEVIGINKEKDYLLILDPANPAVSVWLKHESSNLTGEASGLPIAPPPPLPLVETPHPVPTLGDSPTPIGGGSTPVSSSTPVSPPSPGSGCPTPIGGGPTPVSCPGYGVPSVESGCPTPIGGGPTPVSCSPVTPPASSGCPTPIGGGPTPVSCPGHGAPIGSGCPTPIGGGPTPVSCPGYGAPPVGSGCPTPIGGGPTPVTCLH